MTQSEISTIAYGSVPFLRGQLEHLRSAGVLSEYMLLLHDRDVSDDGALKKAHVHIWACPARRVDITAIRNSLVMPVPGDKPLGCLEVRRSKRDDWLLYALHHPTYLASKGSSDGKYEYPLSDLVFSDGIDPAALLVEALSSFSHTSAALASSLLSGSSAIDLLLAGASPVLLSAAQRVLSSSFSPLSLEERRAYERTLSHLEDILAALDAAHLRYAPSPTGGRGSIFATDADFTSRIFVDLDVPDADSPFVD